MRGLGQHARAFWNVLRRTERNSSTEKAVLWGVMGLWFLGGAGVLFGVVPLEKAAAKELWAFLTAAVTYLFGRIHGQELADTDPD